MEPPPRNPATVTNDEILQEYKNTNDKMTRYQCACLVSTCITLIPGIILLVYGNSFPYDVSLYQDFTSSEVTIDNVKCQNNVNVINIKSKSLQNVKPNIPIPYIYIPDPVPDHSFEKYTGYTLTIQATHIDSSSSYTCIYPYLYTTTLEKCRIFADELYAQFTWNYTHAMLFQKNDLIFPIAISMYNPLADYALAGTIIIIVSSALCCVSYVSASNNYTQPSEFPDIITREREILNKEYDEYIRQRQTSTHGDPRPSFSTHENSISVDGDPV